MEVDLEPWSAEHGLDLLRRTNAPELMVHLGGPESDEQLEARHRRYLDGRRTGTATMFAVVVPGHPQGVGAIGYWHAIWRDQAVYESGWSVQPEWHGRGIATTALLGVLEHAASVGSRRYLHALPKVENAPSNAVCRRAGLALRGEASAEYPSGHPIIVNDWVADLHSGG